MALKRSLSDPDFDDLALLKYYLLINLYRTLIDSISVEEHKKFLALAKKEHKYLTKCTFYDTWMVFVNDLIIKSDINF